ncbi:unnamed protein product [Clavelina lepadiformis]|uniref:Uncharacterized protein n=1 Tax=Clavelina lepadiformis TaxID=159417 RepID=A0ABP0FZK1_CLALP
MKLMVFLHATAQGDAHANLVVGWIPIDFPNNSLENAPKKMGLPNSSSQGRDSIKSLKDGLRNFKVLKKGLVAANPPPSFSSVRTDSQYNMKDKSKHVIFVQRLDIS